MNTDTLIRKIEDAACWYIRRKVGKTSDVEAAIASAQAREPERVVETLTERAARRAAARAFVTGLFGSPLTAIPLSLVDMEGATSAQSKLAAAMGKLSDPSFFEREDWDREVLHAMLEMDATADSAPRFGAALVRRTVIGRVKKSGMRVVSNALPSLLGGLAGAGMEYMLVKRAASKMKGRFEPTASAEPLEPRAIETEKLTPRYARPAASMAADLN